MSSVAGGIDGIEAVFDDASLAAGLVAVLLVAGTLVYVHLFKMVSFMQSRLGPMEAGPYGSLQLMAGWGSASKYSLLGGLRATGQLIAYELPLLLAVVGVVIQAETMNLQEIVFAQANGEIFGWGVIGNPFTFPRFREDQLQRLAWKFLVPLALANIVVTGVLKVLV